MVVSESSSPLESGRVRPSSIDPDHVDLGDPHDMEYLQYTPKGSASDRENFGKLFAREKEPFVVVVVVVGDNLAVDSTP